MASSAGKFYGTAIVKRLHRDRVDISVGNSPTWWHGVRLVGPVVRLEVGDTVIVYKSGYRYFALALLKG